MRAPLFLLLVIASACRGPDPAPDRIEDLLGWMFQHADDEDQDALSDGVDKAAVWVDAHFDETLEGYVINPLTEEQLTAVGAGGRDRTQIRGVALGYPFTADAGEVAAQLMLQRQVADQDTGDREDVTLVEGDSTCFANGTCDWVVFDVDQITELGFGIELETWNRYQYRRLDTELGEVLMLRSWSLQTPEATTDLFSLLQTYQMWMLLPDGDGHRSIEGEWVDARVGDDGLDMDFVMNMWINGLRDTDERLNEAASD